MLLIPPIVCLTMLCHVIPPINLNLTLIYSGSTKISHTIVKLKFSELEAEVYIFRINYIEFFGILLDMCL